MTSSNPIFFKNKAVQNSSRATKSSNPSRSYERYLLKKIVKEMGSPSFTVTLWDGFSISPQNKDAVANLHIHNREALTHLFRKGDMGFGDQFSCGGISIEGDLVSFLVQAFSIAEPHGLGKLVKSIQQRKPRSNTKNGSRENIHHHYDIGNSFYSLWLDPEMQYTCAYFPSTDMTLQQAQQAKMDHICKKLQIKSGDRVAEAGCGWGGFARHMAVNYGAKVSSWNVSEEQVKYATDRSKKEGYESKVNYILDDYRNISGEYDVFVSVGMLEHVGPDNYNELGDVIDRCLAWDGRGLIHTIGRNRARLMNAWIEKRIFPGAYPPTLSEMMNIFEPCKFSILDVENLRLHYARTLKEWLFLYDKEYDKISSEFDEDFCRAWRLYLAGSQAAFIAGNLQLFQVLFSREKNNKLSCSRNYMYE